MMFGTLEVVLLDSKIRIALLAFPCHHVLNRVHTSFLHTCLITSPTLLPFPSLHVLVTTPLTLDTDEYELRTCRLRELVSLGLQRVGAQYTEWGALACSSSGDTIAIVDTERHLYITDFRQRSQLGKKGELL